MTHESRERPRNVDDMSPRQSSLPPQSRQMLLHRPAVSAKVDGKSTRNPRKSDPIAPGKHSITLHFDSARGNFRPVSLDVEIDLQACTRYRIVANYEVKTGGDWETEGLFRADRRMRQEIQEVRCAPEPIIAIATADLT